MPFFEELTYRSDPLTDFYNMMAQTTRTYALLGFVHMAPHLGGQTPKKQFWHECVFLSQTREIGKRGYYQNYCIDRFQPNFAQ